MWKNHIEMIKQKLSVACFAFRTIKHLATQNVLRRFIIFNSILLLIKGYILEIFFIQEWDFQITKENY